MVVEISEFDSAKAEPLSRQSDPSSTAKNIAHQLLDVELLYLLNLRPESLRGLSRYLITAFGIDPGATSIFTRLKALERSGLVMVLPEQASSGEIYAISPLGTQKLGEGIESLSEISLTMQLGLCQKLTKISD